MTEEIKTGAAQRTPCVHIKVNPNPVMDDDYVQPLADIYKVLGDPTRLRILRVLLHDEVCVYDISRQSIWASRQFPINCVFCETRGSCSSGGPVKRYTIRLLTTTYTLYWQ